MTPPSDRPALPSEAAIDAVHRNAWGYVNASDNRGDTERRQRSIIRDHLRAAYAVDFPSQPALQRLDSDELVRAINDWLANEEQRVADGFSSRAPWDSLTLNQVHRIVEAIVSRFGAPRVTAEMVRKAETEYYFQHGTRASKLGLMERFNVMADYLTSCLNGEK